MHHSLAARSVVALLLVAGGAGCAETFPPNLPSETGDTGDTETSLTKVNNDLGYISVVQNAGSVENPTALTTAKAVFLVNNYDVLNPAECFSNGAFCVVDGDLDGLVYGAYPTTPGEVIRLAEVNDVVDDDLLYGLSTIDVVDGDADPDELSFGPLTMVQADVTIDEDEALEPHTNVFYSKIFNDLTLPVNGVALEAAFSGAAWGDRTVSTIAAPRPMVVTSHDPMVRQDFLSTEDIVLTWEPDPDSSGQVFLQVEVPGGLFLQLLEDDGYHELPPDVFFLQEDDDITVVLGRWARATIDVDGHSLQVDLQHNQALVGTFTALGDRAELTSSNLYDDCAEAEGAPFITTGLYFGDLADYRNDYFNLPNRLGSPCLPIDAQGPDAVLPVRLQADELLQVEYLQRNEDAAIYLVQNLCDGGEPGADPVCVEGVDEKLRRAQEALAFRNNTGGPLDLWIILDSIAPNVTDLFELNIGLEASLENPLQSSCADAMLQGPIDEGSYFGSMGTFPNLLECIYTDDATGYPVPVEIPGGDGKAELYLLPGETLNVEVFAPGAGPSAYLVYNCALSESCVGPPVGNGANDTVNLTYTNDTGVSEHLYLVVDSGRNGSIGAVQEYFLDIEIQ